MGRETQCEVMARRPQAGKEQRNGYSDLRILEAPGDFPDGDYVLHLDPVMVSVRRRSGEWLLGNELLTEHKISQPATASSRK